MRIHSSKNPRNADPQYPLQLLTLVRRNAIHSQILPEDQQPVPPAWVAPDNPLLPGIGQPVLLVWGNQDRVLDVSSAEKFDALLPDVQTEFIDEAGHALVNEKPRDAARLYREFLARQTASDQ